MMRIFLLLKNLYKTKNHLFHIIIKFKKFITIWETIIDSNFNNNWKGYY